LEDVSFEKNYERTKKSGNGKSWTTIFEVYGEEEMIYDPPLATTDKLKNIEVVLEF